MRKSDETKYAHLKEPLHVLIEVEAQKSEAHARLAAALAEIKKYMAPVSLLDRCVICHVRTKLTLRRAVQKN